MVQDLKRGESLARDTTGGIVENTPGIIRPSFFTVTTSLRSLLRCAAVALPLTVDIETRSGHIACLGLTDSKEWGLCIPFMCVEHQEGYWTLDEEAEIIFLLYLLLTHKNVFVIGQNFLYDAQYIHKAWHFTPHFVRDTMLAHHTCYSTLQKGLDFLASMYCKKYTYWKSESKDWDPKVGEDQLWLYNLKDLQYTHEVDEVEQEAIAKLTAGGWTKLPQVQAFQQALFWPVLEAMQRGVRIDTKRRSDYDLFLQSEISRREEWFRAVLGHPLNPRSAPQTKALFYEDFRQKVIKDRKTGNPTLDEEALTQIGEREPLLLPLIRRITEHRSLGVFLSTFVRAALDPDNRMRCSYNIAGTATYRFSSSENAFGNGSNLQNLPKGGDDDDTGLELPNIRELFIPDPGFEFFDIDLSSADLRIVVWESDEREMKAILREGKNPYVEIAKEFYHDPTITKQHPKYRHFKSFAHGCITAGHELLTTEGWVKVEDYEDGTPIMVCSPQEERSWFEVPSSFTRDLGVHFHSITGQSSNFEFTYDHRMPYTTDDSDNLRSQGIESIPSSARIPYTTLYEGRHLPPSEEFVRLVAALQADGTIDPHGNVMFHFRKERKILRMRLLLLLYEHNENVQGDGSTVFYVPRRAADFAKHGKSAGPYLLNWRGEALDAFLDEAQHWDGWAGGTVQCHISSVDKEHCEWIQTIARLRGRGSQITLQRSAEDNRKDLYRVTMNSRKFLNLSSTSRESYETAPRAVYCPTTSTGFFLLRRNGCIVVSGNTHYLGTAQGLAQRLGLTVHETERTQQWYFGRFPRIKAYQQGIIDQINKRHFIENIFGYRCYFFDRIDNATYRKGAAWLPQSTIACLINRIWVKLRAALPQVQVLLQVHDSLAGQYPSYLGEWARKRIVEESAIELPYSEPLTIPVGIKHSTISWGACE